MSAIDIASHDNFFLFEEDDAYCPDWNQNGKEEEYGNGSSSKEDIDYLHALKDFSPLKSVLACGGGEASPTLTMHLLRKCEPEVWKGS